VFADEALDAVNADTGDLSDDRIAAPANGTRCPLPLALPQNFNGAHARTPVTNPALLKSCSHRTGFHPSIAKVSER
jgi:hypothetical protein